MERFTFSDPAVRRRRCQFLLRSRPPTAADKALLTRFGLFGPPGIVFFDSPGQEIEGRRIVGFQETERFLRNLPAANG